MEISRASPEDAPGVWSQLSERVGRALSHGCGDSITSERMLEKIVNGDMQLWVVHEGQDVLAGVVLSGHQYPSKVTLAVELLAGKGMDQWASLVEATLRSCAELMGADTVEASCRAGLAERLVKRGWKRKAVIMELQ